MRIGDKKTAPVADAIVKELGSGRGVASGAGVRALQSDKVKISAGAKELMRARRLMETLPDIRTDKVKSLKTVIHSGLYNVEAEKVAAKIIERAIRDAIYVRGKG